MQTEVTVYQRGASIRAVIGAHAEHKDSRAYRIAVYPNAALAYANESDGRVRTALLLIAPDADKATVGAVRAVAIPAKVRKCAHPAGCDMPAAPGDIYCAGCATDLMLGSYLDS